MMTLNFDFCVDSSLQEFECLEREEAEKYFEQHEVVVTYFESRTSIDFSSKDFKFTNQMDFISVRDRIQKKKVL